MWEDILIIFDSVQILFLKYIRSTDSRNIRNTIAIVFNLYILLLCIEVSNIKSRKRFGFHIITSQRDSIYFVAPDFYYYFSYLSLLTFSLLTLSPWTPLVLSLVTLHPTLTPLALTLPLFFHNYLKIYPPLQCQLIFIMYTEIPIAIEITIYTS